MSTLLKDNKALQNKPQLKGFNMVSDLSPSPIAFDPQPLCVEEVSEIKHLLLESNGIGALKEEQIKKDSTVLTQLTSELRGIGKQGVFLMGERVLKAREILKPYKGGTFTRWLTKTFGTRKTGYNALSYYELFQDLPNKDIREKFMKIPLSAAYVLASREGKLEKKVSLINDFSGEKQSNIIASIKKKFPTDKKGGRSSTISTESLINLIFSSLEKLESKKDFFSLENKKRLKKAKSTLKNLLL